MKAERQRAGRWRGREGGRQSSNPRFTCDVLHPFFSNEHREMLWAADAWSSVHTCAYSDHSQNKTLI